MPRTTTGATSGSSTELARPLAARVLCRRRLPRPRNHPRALADHRARHAGVRGGADRGRPRPRRRVHEHAGRALGLPALAADDPPGEPRHPAPERGRRHADEARALARLARPPLFRRSRGGPRYGPPHPPTLVAPRGTSGAPRYPPTLVAPRGTPGAPRCRPTLVAPRE